MGDFGGYYYGDPVAQRIRYAKEVAKLSARWIGPKTRKFWRIVDRRSFTWTCT